MMNFLKQRIKIVVAVLVIITSIIALKIKSNENVATITEEKATFSTIEVKKGSRVYESTNDIPQEVNVNLDKKSNKVEINTKDTKAPDNINNISVQVLEDNAIINFNRPKDNGNYYEYIVENEKEEEKLNFYSESGFYGYSYKINNNEEDSAEEKVNKIDDLPFIIQNINWNKDYYLHIRTADSNNNFSESKTFKINLPSNGVNIEYVDINTNKKLASSEKILGMINEKYNASNVEKELLDYTFVEIDGDVEGKLKKEQVNVKYKYAKNMTLTIKYIDKQTGKELVNSKEVKGYEGKVIDIEKININGYTCETNIDNIKMNKENETLSLMYSKTGNIVISYIDETTNKKLCKDEIQSLVYGSKYSFKPKEFENYELVKSTENDNGALESDCINVVYYYKQKFVINLKYVDIDTDEVVCEEKIVTTKGNKIKVKIKEIEGYKLIEDNNKDSIIDEIIKSLGSDLETEIDSEDGLTVSERENIKSRYEIVMNCDDSDYIIYYKKV